MKAWVDCAQQGTKPFWEKWSVWQIRAAGQGRLERIFSAVAMGYGHDGTQRSSPGISAAERVILCAARDGNLAGKHTSAFAAGGSA
jgi:hypothetical protein